MKKTFLVFVLALVSFAFAEDAVLLHDFVIDGAKVQKKVRIVSKHEYNYAGKIIRAYSPGDSDFIYFYNTDGMIEKLFYTYGYESKKGVWWYEYNIEKNLTEIKTADYSVVEYFYDDNTKLLVRKNDSGGVDEKYEYDENGRIIKITDQWDSFEYRYNDAGNLIWKRNGNGENFYRYDSKNRLVYDLWITFSDNNVILERITEFDDDNFTETMHTNRLGDGNVTYTSAEFHKYNSQGLPLYSRYETESFSTNEFVLSLMTKPENRNWTTEYFYKYGDSEYCSQETKISKGVETNYFYEYSFWDNGNLNTVIIYEEVK